MKNLLKSLAAFQQEVKVIHKATQGYGYSYSDLPKIFSEINPLLQKHGLGFTQLLDTKEGIDYIATVIFHVESGETLESKVAIPQVELKGMNDYQSFGSGVTYFRRYALSSALGLVTDKDTDASGEQIKKKPTIDNKRLGKALEMIAEGVDIIDIGGESTRPGADRVTALEEQKRVIPVIEKLSQTGIPISIDTMHAQTAELAITAGASIVNDVSGGLADGLMHEVVAEMGCPYILMHWRGHSKDMNSQAIYGDVVKDVIAELNIQIDAALRSGIAKNNLIIDPGLGFAKDAAQNWEILNRIDEITDLGFPVLIGGSRKRFLGGETPDEREVATIALTQTLLAKNIWAVRVHSVSPHKKLVLANG